MIEAKGPKGHVRFDGQTVSIAYDTLGGRLTSGDSETLIPLQQIVTVELKKPQMLSNSIGFIRFVTAGSATATGLASKRAKEAFDDPNALGFWKNYTDFERIRDAVMAAIGQRQEMQTAPQPTMPPAPDAMQQMQQLAAMRDAGMISPEEFEAKRRDILARM